MPTPSGIGWAAAAAALATRAVPRTAPNAEPLETRRARERTAVEWWV